MLPSDICHDPEQNKRAYRNVFKGILEIDPNLALQSASDLMPSIDMPGVGMSNFKDMAEVAYKTGVYGPWDYKEIVEQAIEFWKIADLSGLNQMGEKAREKILKIPDRLGKVAEYFDMRMKKKEFSFDFLYKRNFTI